MAASRSSTSFSVLQYLSTCWRRDWFRTCPKDTIRLECSAMSHLTARKDSGVLGCRSFRDHSARTSSEKATGIPFQRMASRTLQQARLSFLRRIPPEARDRCEASIAVLTSTTSVTDDMASSSVSPEEGEVQILALSCELDLIKISWPLLRSALSINMGCNHSGGLLGVLAEPIEP